jgi:hypothetical protein
VGCIARKFVDHYPDSTQKIQYIQMHNHPPPLTQRVPKEAKDEGRELIRKGVKVGKVHSMLLQTNTNVPAPSQLSQNEILR